MRNFRRTLLTATALLLVVAACGDTTAAAENSDHDETEGVTTERVVEVSMTEFGFSTGPIEVFEGETVTFVVTNDGAVDHEFRLANDEIVEEHDHGSDHEDTDGTDMEMMSVLLLAPGETGELVVTFDHDATFTEVTCLLPGHREAGMVTPLQISE